VLKLIQLGLRIYIIAVLY